MAQLSRNTSPTNSHTRLRKFCLIRTRFHLNTLIQSRNVKEACCLHSSV